MIVSNAHDISALLDADVSLHSLNESERGLAPNTTAGDEGTREDLQKSKLKDIISLRRSTSNPDLTTSECESQSSDEEGETNNGPENERKDDGGALGRGSVSARIASRGRPMLRKSLSRRDSMHSMCSQRSRSRSTSKREKQSSSFLAEVPGILGGSFPELGCSVTPSANRGRPVLKKRLSRRGSMCSQSSKSRSSSKQEKKRNSSLAEISGLPGTPRAHKFKSWDDTSISTTSSGITFQNKFYNPYIIYCETGDMNVDRQVGRRSSLQRSVSDRCVAANPGPSVRKQGNIDGLVTRSSHGPSGKRESAFASIHGIAKRQGHGANAELGKQGSEDTRSSRSHRRTLSVDSVRKRGNFPKMRRTLSVDSVGKRGNLPGVRRTLSVDFVGMRGNFPGVRRTLSGNSVGIRGNLRRRRPTPGTNLSKAESSLRELESSAVNPYIVGQPLRRSKSSDLIGLRAAARRTSHRRSGANMLRDELLRQTESSDMEDNELESDTKRSGQRLKAGGRIRRCGSNPDISTGLGDCSVIRRISTRTGISRAKVIGSKSKDTKACVKRTVSGSGRKTQRGSSSRLDQIADCVRDANTDGGRKSSQRGSTKQLGHRDYTTFRSVDLAERTLEMGAVDSAKSETSVKRRHPNRNSVSRTESGSSSRSKGRRNLKSEDAKSVEQGRQGSRSDHRSFSALPSGDLEATERRRQRSRSGHRSPSMLHSADKEGTKQTRQRSRSGHRSPPVLHSTDKEGTKQSHHSRSKQSSSSTSKVLPDGDGGTNNSQRVRKPTRRSSLGLLFDDEDPRGSQHSRSKHRSCSNLMFDDEEPTFSKRTWRKPPSSKKERAKRVTSQKTKSDSCLEKKKKHQSAPDLIGLARSKGQGNEGVKSQKTELTVHDLLVAPKPKTLSDSYSRWSKLDSSKSKLALETFGKMSSHHSREFDANHSFSGDSFCGDGESSDDDDFTIPTIISGGSTKFMKRGGGDGEGSQTVISGKHGDGSTKSRPSVKSLKREAAASALQKVGDLESTTHTVDIEAASKAQRLIQLQKTWKAARNQLVNTT